MKILPTGSIRIKILSNYGVISPGAARDGGRVVNIVTEIRGVIVIAGKGSMMTLLVMMMTVLDRCRTGRHCGELVV